MIVILVLYYIYVANMMVNHTLDNYTSFTLRNKLNENNKDYNDIDMSKNNFMIFFEFRALEEIDSKTYDIF